MNAADQIRRSLQESQRIAIVGLSDNPQRASHQIARYLIRAGYTIIPVNPTLTEVLGLKAYPTLSEIPEPVDLVNVFRRSEALPQIVNESIEIGAKYLWTQLGVVDHEAAKRAEAAGITVIMDLCIKIEHAQLSQN